MAWVAMPSSRGSSRPRDGPRGSCVSGTGRRALHHCACVSPSARLPKRGDEDDSEAGSVREHPYQLPGLPQALTTPILSTGCAVANQQHG